jgi:hypothetical protein
VRCHAVVEVFLCGAGLCAEQQKRYPDQADEGRNDSCQAALDPPETARLTDLSGGRRFTLGSVAVWTMVRVLMTLLPVPARPARRPAARRRDLLRASLAWFC